MALYSNGEKITFKYIFNLDGDFYDPIILDNNWQQRDSLATPYYGGDNVDIVVSICRGQNGSGPVVDGPFSYNAQSATPDYGIAIQDQLAADNDLSQILEKNYIERESEGIYNFVYTIPDNLFPGKYTVVLTTSINQVREIRELYFQIVSPENKKEINISSKSVEDNIAVLTTTDAHGLTKEEVVTVYGVDNAVDGVHQILSIPTQKSFSIYVETQDVELTSVNPTGSVFRQKDGNPVVLKSNPSLSTSSQVNAIYKPLQPFNTNSVLLIGHGDSQSLQINEIRRIASIQEAIDLLGGNRNSPLLRAVLSCHGAGCTDIYIMIAAPMSEYVDDYQRVNTPIAGFVSENSSTPSTLTFYEKYHERLQETYAIARDYDFIDIIVPVSVSFINSGNVNFVRQLADHCEYVYKNSSTISIGIIGSRTGGMNLADIEAMSAIDFTTNLLKDENGNSPDYLDSNDGNILDSGRHIMLYYGEAVFNYPALAYSYTSSIAAAVAGQLSNWPVYRGLNRQKLRGAYSQYGLELTAFQVAKLHNNNINTIIKNNRSRRNVPYQVILSEDKTLAKKGSSMANIPQVRLTAMVINEILGISNSAIGKFSYDIIKEKLQSMFNSLKKTTPSIIQDYRFEMYADKKQKGKIYLEIDLISSNSLKKINFNILAGPGA